MWWGIEKTNVFSSQASLKIIIIIKNGYLRFKERHQNNGNDENNNFNNNRNIVQDEVEDEEEEVFDEFDEFSEYSHRPEKKTKKKPPSLQLRPQISPHQQHIERQKHDPAIHSSRTIQRTNSEPFSTRNF